MRFIKRQSLYIVLFRPSKSGTMLCTKNTVPWNNSNIFLRAAITRTVEHTRTIKACKFLSAQVKTVMTDEYGKYRSYSRRYLHWRISGNVLWVRGLQFKRTPNTSSIYSEDLTEQTILTLEIIIINPKSSIYDCTCERKLFYLDWCRLAFTRRNHQILAQWRATA